jgi:hypothetical protein
MHSLSFLTDEEWLEENPVERDSWREVDRLWEYGDATVGYVAIGTGVGFVGAETGLDTEGLE